MVIINSGRNEEKTVFFRVLSERQIQKIKQAAFNILKNTWCKVSHPEALNLLKEAGAEVKGERVWVPQKLVEQCIESAPKGFTIYDRNGNHTMEVKDIYFSNYIGG